MSSEITVVQAPSRKLYKYKPLEEKQRTRLLKVERDSKAQSSSNAAELSVRYDILEFALDALPEYETVSYAWGSPDKDSFICIEGEKIMPVTESLASGLSRLTEYCKTGYLWVDQIRINQEDTLERNHQVTLMGTIYRNAVCGLICLGELPHIPDESKLATVLQNYDIRQGIAEASSPACDKFELEAMLPAVSMLLDQPWFTRAWVFQEAVLAKKSTFLSRSMSLSFDSLAALVRDMWDLPKLLWPQETPGIAFLRQAARLRRKAKGGAGASISLKEFYWYLNLMAYSTASDPRDHVYAFIGLLPHNDEEPVSIQPDYEKSDSDVFITTAESLIKSTGRLDLFCLLPLENHSSGNRSLPSWVPDWSQRRNWNLCLGRVDFPLLKCAGDFSHTLQITNYRQLRVQGKMIDTIVNVGGELYHEEGGHRHLLVEEQRTELVDVAQLTTYADMTRDRILRACFGPGATDLEQCRIVFEKSQSQQNDFIVPSSKRIAFGDQKKLVLLHQSARSGDRIAVLHGSGVPIVLRRQREGFYQVIGQCYYEGAMYGEAVDWEQDEADIFTLV